MRPRTGDRFSGDRRAEPDSLGRSMRVLIVTDAWHPQINGVVRTLERLAENLPAQNAEAQFLSPQLTSARCPMPSYPDIRLALATPGQVVRARIAAARPDHVHIATEGPARPHGAAHLPGARPRLHHQLSHALPGISSAPGCRSRSPGPTAGCAVSTMPAPAPWSPRRRWPPTLRRAASSGSPLDARRRHRPVLAGPPAGSRPAAPDLPVGRPRGGREEPVGLPRSRSARQQGRRRRRSGAGQR